MKKLGNLLGFALFVSVLGIALSLPTSEPAIAAGPDVTVANTPLPVQGTVGVNNFPATQPVSGTVNVGNFPATQPVSGSVGITGTPNVNVTNFPATQAVTVGNFPATQTVNVANGAAAPVQVADVERMARIPYMSSVHVVCAAGPAACFFFFASPPSGTRLVAEHLSGYFQISSAATAPVVGYVEDSAPNFTMFTAFTAPLAGLDLGGHTQAAFSQSARFYVDGGDGVFAVVSTTWSNGNSHVILSGYLEDCSVTGCPAIAQ